jgi:hypothetical protein
MATATKIVHFVKNARDMSWASASYFILAKIIYQAEKNR